VKENNDSTRISAFLDVGNVFNNNLCNFTTECLPYRTWSADQLRASVGLSFSWRAPVGPIVINFAKPIRKKPGDDTETIQFMFGNTF
jgi:outer membrane protein insertion porin family